MQRSLKLLFLLGLLVLTFAARCHNLRDVFVESRIYFVDADCYSRMTRARLVAEHPGALVRHHDFENFPPGVRSHATAPLDYLIVITKKLLDAGFWWLDREGTSVLDGQTLDLAGALVSPLLGVAGAAFLAAWGWALRLRFWAMGVVLYAISPILVHGTVLGRPDHQSLLIVLLLTALGAEIALARRTALEIDPAQTDTDRQRQSALSVRVHPCLSVAQFPVSMRSWGVTSGAAWALSLWVSLYEPLVLFAVVIALWLAWDRRALFAPERRAGWITFAAILALALLLEGWPLQAPDPTMLAYFGRWKASIGELAPLDLRTPLLFRWLGWSVLAVPVLLLLLLGRRKPAPPSAIGPWSLPIGHCCLLSFTFVLTLWQIRWGYFLAVVFVLTLPFFLTALSRAWVAWLVFVVALWPIAQDWDAQLFPDAATQRDLAVKRAENVALREIVAAKTGANGGPFLAPWWLSPPLAYWTRQPGVAGSSHESLPGTVDAARIFLAPNADAALPLLRARQIAWILADAPERVIPTSAALLGIPPPERCFAAELAQPFPSDPQASLLTPESSPPHAPHPAFFRIWNVPVLNDR